MVQIGGKDPAFSVIPGHQIHMIQSQMLWISRCNGGPLTGEVCAGFSKSKVRGGRDGSRRDAKRDAPVVIAFTTGGGCGWDGARRYVDN